MEGVGEMVDFLIRQEGRVDLGFDDSVGPVNSPGGLLWGFFVMFKTVLL